MDFDALRDRFRRWSDGWAFWSDVIWFGIKQAGGLWIIAGLYLLVAIRLGRSFWVFLVALVERLPVWLDVVLMLSLFLNVVNWLARVDYFIEQKREAASEEEAAASVGRVKIYCAVCHLPFYSTFAGVPQRCPLCKLRDGE